MRLIPEKILVFYDTAQVFVGVDETGTRLFIALLYKNTEYIVAEVSPERLRQYYNGEVDLRRIFTEHEIGNSLYITEGENFELTILEDKDLQETMLPKEGYYNETE